MDEVERPSYTWYNMFTEGIKYMWNPKKTCKNEIMRGNMSAERIREVVEYGISHMDSWGNPIVSEEGLKFLYKYNEQTIDYDHDLKEFIKESVRTLRRMKTKTSGIYHVNNEGEMEECTLNCVDVDWLE